MDIFSPIEWLGIIMFLVFSVYFWIENFAEPSVDEQNTDRKGYEFYHEEIGCGFKQVRRRRKE